MKISIRTLLISFIIISAVLAFASWRFSRQPPAQLDITQGLFGNRIEGRSNTHVFDLTIQPEILTKLPKWDRRNANPPVSANEAMVLAQEYRDKLVTAKQFPSGSTITSAQLIPIGESDVWYWVVNFLVEQTGNPFESLEVVVLMDGNIAPLNIRERIDAGWPPPSHNVSQVATDLTSEQIAGQFVERLNIDRAFAGQVVELSGTIESIPDGHEDRKSGRTRYFKSTEGHQLIFWFPHSVPASDFEGEIEITGKLLGFRDRSVTSESWKGLKLYPGIRPNALRGKRATQNPSDSESNDDR